jgi:15-cis-phytoene synthase/lycopene beta-cyclase
MSAIDYKYLLHYKKTLVYCVLSALIFSLPWDYWAIKTNVWFFPAEKIVGVWMFGVPLEEYLFIIFATLEICILTLFLKNMLTKKL